MDYKIGDFVYYATYEMKQVQKKCLICFGKKEVTLILGNDEHWILPCTYCDVGYSGPRGYREEWEFIAESSPKTITDIEINITAGGESREYKSGYLCLSQDRIFDTKEKALEKCEELIKQKEKEENTRTEYIKKDKAKSFSWNAGYHMRQVKQAKKEIEYHSQKARLCKERAKTAQQKD